MLLEGISLAAEESYQLFFEHSPQPMWVFDSETLSFLAVNNAAVEAYGYSKDEFLSMTIKDIRHSKEIPFLLDQLSIDDSSYRQNIWSHKKKGGGIIDVMITSNSIEFDGRRANLVLATNVTERLRAEEELRFQKMILEAQSEASIDGILVVEKCGKILSYNKRFVEIWEVPQQALGTRSNETALQTVLEKLINPEEFLARINYLYEHPCEASRDEIHLKDGRTLDRYSAPIKNAAGQDYGRVWFFQDITQRKQSADDLRRQKEILQKIFDHIPVMISFFDENGRLMLVNREWERTRGWTLKEIQEQNLDILAESYPDPKELQRARDFLTASTGEWADFKITVKDGEVIDTTWAAARLSDATCVAIGQNITERKRADENLSRLAAIVECSDTAIISQTLDGTITSWNHGAERIYGYSESEVIGQSISIIAPKDRLEEFSLFLDKIRCGERVEHFETVRQTKDGRLIDISLTISAIRNKTGQIVGASSIASDVTERKRTEEALRQSGEQLQQAQKMESVGRLAGGVAHDFNNLLTAIIGYSDLTLRKLNRSDPLRENLEEVKKAAERASGLTRQLLAFSRKQVMQPKVIDLNAIISEMNRMLPRLIGEDIKIEKRLAADLGRVEADPGQIEQVIVNLVVNARDAMPQGGTLTVETSNVTMDEELVRKYVSVQRGAHILLAISDTGCGIDEETQRHIFEPFFTTKELGKGTGLGLSTVFGIVKQSKGSIWVNSDVGKGTTFCIYLPRVDAQVDAPEVKVALKKIAKGTGTVLLVEDDDLVRGIARATLEMCGYKVLEAANGGEALLIIREHRCKIDLMLTDVIMPRMSGRTLVQEVASLCPEMKMLYMSGYTDDVIMPHGVFQEGLAFIHKPFTPEALSRKVREVLEG